MEYEWEYVWEEEGECIMVDKGDEVVYLRGSDMIQFLELIGEEA